MSLVGRQALLQGKLQSPVPLALEGGSGAVRVPAASSPSCAAGSLSPSHTADELVPPTDAHRHCNYRREKLTVRVELFMAGGEFTFTEKSFSSDVKSNVFKGETYSLIVSLQVVRTTQSMGRVVDRKCDFWTVLLRIGADRGPVFVASIIRRRLMTLWATRSEFTFTSVIVKLISLGFRLLFRQNKTCEDNLNFEKL